MAGSQETEAQQGATGDGITSEVIRLVKLVRRLEYENASLRQELAAVRPLAA